MRSLLKPCLLVTTFLVIIGMLLWYQEWRLNANQKKLLGTMHTLETIWYCEKYTAPLQPGTLYSFLASKIPAMEKGEQDVFAMGAPLNSIASLKNRYCRLPGKPLPPLTGYISLPNGVLLSGLNQVYYQPRNDKPNLPLNQYPKNTVFCLDLNGVAGPNRLGEDLFLGNFNPSGDFDVIHGNFFQINAGGKNFNWGSRTVPLYDAEGYIYASPYMDWHQDFIEQFLHS